MIVKTNIVVIANQTAAVDAQLAPSGSGGLRWTSRPRPGACSRPRRRCAAATLRRAGHRAAISTRNPAIARAHAAGRLLEPLRLRHSSNNRRAAPSRSTAARGRSNNFLIDGTENNDISVAGQGFQIKNPDAVQEVSVQTSNYDAEFGRAGGAVVNTITKSGSNRFHGTLAFLYDSTADDAIDQHAVARPATSASAAGRPTGPSRSSPARSAARSTCRASARAARPSTTGATATSSSPPTRTSARRRQTTANIVSLSPAGRARLRGLFPAGANRNVDTFLTVTNGVDATSQFFNQALGAGRPAIEFGTAVTSFAQTFTEPQIPGARRPQARRERPALGALPLRRPEEARRRRDARPARLHDERVEPLPELPPHRDARLLADGDQRAAAGLQPDHLRFPLDPPEPLALVLPSIIVNGLTNQANRQTNIGIQTNLPQGRIANNYVIQDTLTYIRGNHTFRFGVRPARAALAPVRADSTGAACSLTARAAASRPSPISSTISADRGRHGQALIATSAARSTIPELFRQAYFFQDRWRATEALTLTLGLRYENFGTPMNSLRTAAFTGLFNIDPVTWTGPFRPAEQVQADNNNFAPTVGIAYSPSFDDGSLGRLFGERKTVYPRRLSDRLRFVLQQHRVERAVLVTEHRRDPGRLGGERRQPARAAEPLGAAAGRGARADAARRADAGRPESRQPLLPALVARHAAVARRQLVLDVSYVGSSGTKLFINEDRNPLVPAALQVDPGGLYRAELHAGVSGLPALGAARQHAGGAHGARQQRLVLLPRGAAQRDAPLLARADLLGQLHLVEAHRQRERDLRPGDALDPEFPDHPAVLGGERNDRAVSLFDRTHRADIHLRLRAAVPARTAGLRRPGRSAAGSSRA